MITDLTLQLSPSLPQFPGSPPVQQVPWAGIRRDGYNLELLFASTHAGTHIDAPYHFDQKGRTVDRIPVGRLVRRARLIRVRPAAGRAITRADIAADERKNGAIARDDTVVIHTGWQKNLRKPGYFAKNPGLSADAARYLRSRKVNMVATDSPSIDPGTDPSFAAHKILCGSDILIVENLANLEKMRDGFVLAVMPLKLKGASGSPVRAVGIYPSTRSLSGL